MTLKSFREFLKEIYETSGFRGKLKLKSVFIFSDNDVVQESFLEDINNMLSLGLVPNLYNKEDLMKVLDDARRPFKQEQQKINSS